MQYNKIQRRTMQYYTLQYKTLQYNTIQYYQSSDSDSDSDSECLTSKVSLCGMQGQMHMPDPLHGILEASHTARFLSVVSLGRLARN